MERPAPEQRRSSAGLEAEMSSSRRGNSFGHRISIVAAVLAALLIFGRPAVAQRVLGLDISAWQGNISQTTWDNIRNVEGRRFVFIRSSRGGTTGFYNQSNPDNDNPPGQNTLSQRYDDPYFVQNITRATQAGMLAGPYHFSRPDIIASTLNSNGIPNSGADEANHFIQMAGAWMRPGYLLPVHDLEAGQTQRTSAQLSAFAVDFSNRMNEVMGIRPMVYSSQNYANYVDATVPPVNPNLWIARWPNQSNPDAIDVQNTNPPPSPSTANVYGEWNPNHTVSNPYPNGHPWKFWQYASTGRLESFNSGNSNLDFDVANGGIEFVKDYLVPALWVTNSSGQWTSLTNWNSGQTPVAPVQGPGQVARVGSLTLPAIRLPGSNDTVILDRPSANITVTLGSGTHNIRKLYVRETLNITGGALTVNYVPTSDSTPIAAQFSAGVSLSGGSLSVHTLQVDATRTFTLGGGSLTLNTVNLMPHSTTPAKLVVNGDVNLSSLSGAAAAINNGAGSGSSGRIDLGGASRAFNVDNGAAVVDLAVNVPIVNGGLTKRGAGTLALNGANTYAGDTIVEAGKLSIASANLANAADVYLATGSLLDLKFTGDPDAIDSLFFNGISQAAGTWGAAGSGAQFTSSLFTGTGRLQVTTFIAPPLQGDYNEDGRVDAADYIVWRKTNGTTGGYNTWRANFGRTSPGTGSGSSTLGDHAAVPEPSTLVILILGVLGLVGRFRR
jgi:autotransporter-associated beta strand protein